MMIVLVLQSARELVKYITSIYLNLAEAAGFNIP